MLFNRLRLKNFKSHKNTEINFKNGINIIVGKNGAGKSTILEAISFALFKQHTSKKIDDLVRNNTNNMSVELEFSVKGKEYKIVREKKSNLKSHFFSKTDSEFIHVCSGDKEVADKVKQVLNIDSDLFLNAVYVRQGEIANLINKSTSEKKTLIAKLLGIDSLENAWKNFLPFINEYEKESSEMKGKLYNLKTIEEEYKDNKKKLKQLLKDKSEKESLKKELDRDVSSLNSVKKDIDKQKKELLELQQKLKIENEKLNTNLSLMKSAQENLDGIEKQEKRLKELSGCAEQLSKAEETLALYNNYIDIKNKLEEKISNNSKKISSFMLESSNKIGKDIDNIYDLEKIIKKETERITNEKDDIVKLLEQRKEQRAVYYQKNHELQKSIDEISNVNNVCPICMSEISEEKKRELETHYKMKKKEFSDLIEYTIEDILILESKESSYLDATSDLNNIAQQLTMFKDIDKQNSEDMKKIDKLKKSDLFSNIDPDVLKNDISILKNKNDEYNRILGFIQNKKSFETEIDRCSKNIDKINNNIKSIELRIDSISIDENAYNSLIDDLTEKENALYDINIRLSEIKGKSSEIITKIRNTQNKITELSLFSSRFDNHSKCIQTLRQIREIYGKNGVQKDLRNTSKPLIQKYTKEFFNGFNFDYSDLMLNEDYEITLYGPEGESSMSMVSGGEKIAIALALRLGITQALSKGELDTILLDEPTIHLDSSRRSELIGLLKDVSLLPQMIIVTHESQLENAADNLIKVEKENGISGIKTS